MLVRFNTVVLSGKGNLLNSYVRRLLNFLQILGFLNCDAWSHNLPIGCYLVCSTTFYFSLGNIVGCSLWLGNTFTSRSWTWYTLLILGWHLTTTSWKIQVLKKTRFYSSCLLTHMSRRLLLETVLLWVLVLLISLIESLAWQIVVFNGRNIASVALRIVLTIFYAHHHLNALRDLILFHLQRMVLDHLRVDVCFSVFSAF